MGEEGGAHLNLFTRAALPWMLAYDTCAVSS